jgi:hypothetical protein
VYEHNTKVKWIEASEKDKLLVKEMTHSIDKYNPIFETLCELNKH